MKQNIIETVMGAVVLVVAGFFLVFSYQTADIRPVTGYEIYADFTNVGGLRPGDVVQVSGVKVGSILNIGLDPDTYLARVRMSIDNAVELPMDTAAIISSEGLLGGRFLSLEPGGDDELITEGGRVIYTQAPQNLEQLLGQFIFSMSGAKDKE